MGIHNARRYIGDRLIRTAKPHRILDPAHGPLIAVKLNILTRKTLGGLRPTSTRACSAPRPPCRASTQQAKPRGSAAAACTATARWKARFSAAACSPAAMRGGRRRRPWRDSRSDRLAAAGVGARARRNNQHRQHGANLRRVGSRQQTCAARSCPAWQHPAGDRHADALVLAAGRTSVEQFIAIFPDGLNRAWPDLRGASERAGRVAPPGTDDVAFLMTLVAKYVAEGTADPKRILRHRRLERRCHDDDAREHKSRRRLPLRPPSSSTSPRRVADAWQAQAEAISISMNGTAHPLFGR